MGPILTLVLPATCFQPVLEQQVDVVRHLLEAWVCPQEPCSNVVHESSHGVDAASAIGKQVWEDTEVVAYLGTASCPT